MITEQKKLDKSETNADNPFIEAQRRFYEWMKKTPTGKFTLAIVISQGAVQGKPKVGITESI